AAGPPGHAHGGSMAAVLDEAMGAAAWIARHVVVAVQLDTSSRRMLPLGTDTLLEAWVERVEGRKVWTRGRLLYERGAPFAEAQALFVTLDPERFGPLLEKVAFALSKQPRIGGRSSCGRCSNSPWRAQTVALRPRSTCRRPQLREGRRCPSGSRGRSGRRGRRRGAFRRERRPSGSLLPRR